VLLKDTSTRAGVELPTPRLKDTPANHRQSHTSNSDMFLQVPSVPSWQLLLNPAAARSHGHPIISVSPAGNFNGDSKDDNLKPDSRPAANTNELGDSWLVPDPRPE